MEGTIGEIRGFAGNFAPRAWAFCEGQLLAISQNQALFSILGTTYGGDGRTSFALPDLRGRVMIGPGTGPGLSTHKLGQRSGLERETLSNLQLPNHTHSVSQTPIVVTDVTNANSGTGNLDTPEGNFPAGITNGYSATNNVRMSDKVVKAAASGGVVTIAPTGGSQPINVMQPYLSVYWIICMQGVFPSRS